MLKIKNASAVIDATQVLTNINLEVKAGEVHAVLGPKASGKSTLAHLIQGRHNITLSTGSIQYRNKEIKKLKPHIRSELGIFTAFQNPPEIEGLSNIDLIKALYESRTGGLFPIEIEASYKVLIESIGLGSKFCYEPVNSDMLTPEEWRKSEVVQMIMLLPDLVILDEIETDLSEEALSHISQIIKNYLEDKTKGVIAITHSRSLLDALEPTHTHVLVNGEIRESGTGELYKRILEDGYPQFS